MTRTYGQQLRWWLDIRQVRPATLARMADMSRQALHNILHGRTTANPETHSSICRALHIAENGFFVDEVSPISSDVGESGSGETGRCGPKEEHELASE